MLYYRDILSFAWSMDKEKLPGFVTYVAFTLVGKLYIDSKKQYLKVFCPPH